MRREEIDYRKKKRDKTIRLSNLIQRHLSEYCPIRHKEVEIKKQTTYLTRWLEELGNRQDELKPLYLEKYWRKAKKEAQSCSNSCLQY